MRITPKHNSCARFATLPVIGSAQCLALTKTLRTRIISTFRTGVKLPVGNPIRRLTICTDLDAEYLYPKFRQYTVPDRTNTRSGSGRHQDIDKFRKSLLSMCRAKTMKGDEKLCNST
jgi:hypothetical protein